MRPTPARLFALLAACALLPMTAAAQPDSAVLAPGPQYAASWLRGVLFGSEYRELWTTPARYEVLDLSTFAGGLTPRRVGGGRQTVSLRLSGADGREYVFRSVDKDLTPESPGNRGGTLRQRLRQDQTRAQLPGAAVVASALLEAAGVPHPNAVLRVMPNDPRLGPFRQRFAGMLGTIEPDVDGDLPGLSGSVEVLDTEELLARLAASPADVVDARAYLRARLMDVLLGDWDRHGEQWHWARYAGGDGPRWVAVPEDRDYAFVSYDGAVAAVVRSFGTPGVVRFGPRYPRLRPLVHNARELDARFLGGLPRAAWDAAAAELRARLADPVIAAAVAVLPREHRARVGPQLEAALRARRDALPAVARAFYRRLAVRPEVHGTGAAERIEVQRRAGGALDVTRYEAGSRRAVFRRRFLPGDTREVRIRPGPGRDTVVVSGRGGCIWVVLEAPPQEDRVLGAEGGPFLLRAADP